MGENKNGGIVSVSVCIMGIGDKRHSHGAVLTEQNVQENRCCSLIQMHGKHICRHPYVVASSLISTSKKSQLSPELELWNACENED